MKNHLIKNIFFFIVQNFLLAVVIVFILSELYTITPFVNAQNIPLF